MKHAKNTQTNISSKPVMVTDKKKVSQSISQSTPAIVSMPSVFVATVMDINENEATIMTDNGEKLHAQITDGCLLKPQSQDKVLAIQEDKGNLLVLTVVQRHNKSNVAKIDIKGAVEVNSESISFKATKSMDFTSNEINQYAANYSRTSVNSSVIADKMHYCAKDINVKTGHLKNIVQTCTSVIGTALQTFGVFSKTVTKSEINKSAMRTDIIDGNFAVTAKSAKMKSDADFHINGKHIFMN